MQQRLHSRYAAPRTGQFLSMLPQFVLVAATLRPLQIINDQGAFVDSATSQNYLENFAPRGLKYGVVSVVGPQSSGKSTLLNTLFGTCFDQMDAAVGRSRTSTGICFQCAPSQPGIVLLDVQGTDSREAGDAGRRFDRQAALFALALSDVLCVNLWENDIGRAQASNLDLLRLVLEVNLELRAAPTNATAAPPRTTLLFVVRDTSPATAARRSKCSSRS